MNNVLIVSSSAKGAEYLYEILKSSNNSGISFAKSGAEARRSFMQNQYDIVLINAPLSDEYGDDFAVSATMNSLSAVILLVKEDAFYDISEKVEDYGVLVLGKPLSRQMLYQALKFIDVSMRRLTGLQKENMKLQNKIEEIRLVDRAKCVLIQYLNMTEPKAHRYIEKQAMDMRMTKKAVAQGILKTYES